MNISNLVFIILLAFSNIAANNNKTVEPAQEILNKAILNDSGEEIEKAFQMGADINAKKAGMIPFVFALLNKKNKAVETLLKLNAQTDQSFIQYAISAKDIKTAFKLEQKHGKANSLYFGKSLLEYALCTYTDDAREISLRLILWSIKNNGACAIKEIFYGNKPMTIMHYAILMYEAINPSFKNSDILTPLAQEIIYELINRGYNVNDVWSIGVTGPGGWDTFIYDRPKALRFFLEKGADPNFIFNVKHGSDNLGMWTPLNFAAWNYKQSALEVLLECGADINKQSHINIIYNDEKKNGLYNPLSIAMSQAAKRGNHFLEIVNFLLKNGASL
ncbi:MAG: hypothetical protein ABIA74_04925 [bacterium]